MMSWAEDPDVLRTAVDARLSGMNKEMSQDMLEIIERMGVEFSPIAVSAKTQDGFHVLYSELQRVFTGGEKFTP
jgi:hypothetical protein